MISVSLQQKIKKEKLQKTNGMDAHSVGDRRGGTKLWTSNSVLINFPLRWRRIIIRMAPKGREIQVVACL